MSLGTFDCVTLVAVVSGSQTS